MLRIFLLVSVEESEMEAGFWEISGMVTLPYGVRTSIAQAAWMKPGEVIGLNLKLVGILTLPLPGMTQNCGCLQKLWWNFVSRACSRTLISLLLTPF